MSMFLGWMPDAATRSALSDLQQRTRAALPADAPRHDWRTPAQWHITLRYLGDAIDEAHRVCIEDAIRSFALQTAPAKAWLVGAQYWPDQRVMVAVIDAADAFKSLLEQLEASVQGCGFAPGHPQTAHVTLAYLAGSEVSAHLLPSSLAVPLRIDRVELLRTVPGGYMASNSWALAGTSTAA